jgi:hypothetical protein
LRSTSGYLKSLFISYPTHNVGAIDLRKLN